MRSKGYGTCHVCVCMCVCLSVCLLPPSGGMAQFYAQTKLFLIFDSWILAELFWSEVIYKM